MKSSRYNRYNSRDSKPFWVSCKLYFSNKHSNAVTGIILTENGELVLKNKKVADTFNEYFGTILEVLDSYYWKDNSEPLSNTKSFDSINNIKKSSKHPKKIIQKKFEILAIFLLSEKFH